MDLPTVASLCSTLGNHLTPVEGFRAQREEVTAVHISELVDPNAYLIATTDEPLDRALYFFLHKRIHARTTSSSFAELSPQSPSSVTNA